MATTGYVTRQRVAAGSSPDHLAVTVVGLGFGDEGKGSIVDYLARLLTVPGGIPPLVVRFNGGPQAAHNVVLPGGEHHTFSQFGSGTLAGSPTHLLPPVLVNPMNLWAEAEHLRKMGVPHPLNRITIDGRCPVITPFHKAMNRFDELRRPSPHGTTGEGVGDCKRDKLDGLETVYCSNLGHREKVVSKLREIRQRKLDDIPSEAFNDPKFAEVLDVFNDPNQVELVADFYYWISEKVKMVDSTNIVGHARTVIIEGAQGVLLDETQGFHPHTTWSNTLPGDVIDFLHQVGHQEVESLGVLRSYATRHGAGPFPTEVEPDTEFAGTTIREHFPEVHNTSGWAGGWRVGFPDLLTMEYAVGLTKVDQLVVTHMDRITDNWPLCIGYETGSFPASVIPRIAPHLWQQADVMHLLRTEFMFRAKPVYADVPGSEYIETLESLLKKPVIISSHGPTYLGKHLATSTD